MFLPATDGKSFVAGHSGVPILSLGSGMAMILLGSVTDSSYKGQFAIRYIGERTFEVRWPGYELAGLTDVPGNQEVPVRTLKLPQNVESAGVAIYFCYKDDAYSTSIQFGFQDPPDECFEFISLGQVFSSGEVQQYFRDTYGNGIRFAHKYFL